MAKIIEKPPIYSGNTYERLDQLRDYLFRIADEINDLERSIISNGGSSGSSGGGGTVDQALNINSANAVANAAVTRALNGKVSDSNLAAVGRTGDYNDLINKPVIPPSAGVDTAMSDTSENAVQNKVIKAYVDGHIPATKTKLSQFIDDLGSTPTHTHSQYLTEQSIEGKVDEPSTEGTSGQVLATNGTGGRYWKTVEGGGGSGDMTKAVYDPQNKRADVFDYADDAVEGLNAELATVAKSGSYNDLTDKPTIPTSVKEYKVVRKQFADFNVPIYSAGVYSKDVSMSGWNPIGVVGVGAYNTNKPASVNACIHPSNNQQIYITISAPLESVFEGMVFSFDILYEKQ